MMQKSAKYALIACVVVVLAGGAAFWWFVLRDDAPSRASLPVRTQSTEPNDPAGSAVPSSPDGTWVIAPGDDVFVGYRIQELFGGDTVKKTAVGRTTAVEGSLTVEGSRVTAASVTADVTKLKSDQSRRDATIRDQGLETATFPSATFTLTEPIDLPGSPTVGQPFDVTAKGDLTLHGVTRPVELSLKASWNGDTITVAGGAPIVLADYGIEPPRSTFVNVDDNGEFELALAFERGAS